MSTDLNDLGGRHQVVREDIVQAALDLEQLVRRLEKLGPPARFARREPEFREPASVSRRIGSALSSKSADKKQGCSQTTPFLCPATLSRVHAPLVEVGVGLGVRRVHPHGTSARCVSRIVPISK